MSELSRNDADCRYSDQGVPLSISGLGVIEAVANGDGQDDSSCQGVRRKLFQGRGLVVVRTSRQSGLARSGRVNAAGRPGAITGMARTLGLLDSGDDRGDSSRRARGIALSEPAEKSAAEEAFRCLVRPPGTLIDVGKLGAT